MTLAEILRRRAVELETGAWALADAWKATGNHRDLRMSDAKAIAAVVLLELAVALEQAGNEEAA